MTLIPRLEEKHCFVACSEDKIKQGLCDCVNRMQSQAFTEPVPQCDKTDVSRSCIGLYMHYDNGDMVNIQDLPKPEYEKLLEQMNALRMAYIALVSRP